VNKSSNTLDWFQPDTFKLSKQVKQYTLIYRDNQTDANRQRYKLAKKQLQSNIRANKCEANQNYNASIKDMKSFSKITKSIIGSSPPPMGMLKDPQTGIETSSADGVTRVLLNQHFPGSINPKPSPNPHHSIKSKVIDLDARELQFINKTKLIEAFSLFGKHKSAGPDNLKPIVLQNLPENT
jgi:hypothetical protein